MGLDFLDASQYIQLPGFLPSASDLTVISSLGIALYIRIDEIPPAYGYIFYYECTQMQDIIWSLQITPSMTLKATLESAYDHNSLTLNVGEWYWIYASRVYIAGGVGVSVVYVNGEKLSLYPVVSSAQGPSKMSSSDKVRFGAGFSGKLRRVQVYSPAALKLNEGFFFLSFSFSNSQ